MLKWRDEARPQVIGEFAIGRRSKFSPSEGHFISDFDEARSSLREGRFVRHDTGLVAVGRGAEGFGQCSEFVDVDVGLWVDGG